MYALLRPSWHPLDAKLADRLAAVGLRNAVRPYRFRPSAGAEAILYGRDSYLWTHANPQRSVARNLYLARAAAHIPFWYDAFDRGCDRALIFEQDVALRPWLAGSATRALALALQTADAAPTGGGGGGAPPPRPAWGDALFLGQFPLRPYASAEVLAYLRGRRGLVSTREPAGTHAYILAASGLRRVIDYVNGTGPRLAMVRC